MKKLMQSQNGYQTRSKQNGFSLIEVLVSTIVISTGLLGIASLQTISLRQNYGSNLLAQATFQSQNIMERMRANMKGVNDGAYNSITGSETVPSCSSDCTATQLANADAAGWASATKIALNDAGTGNVTSTVNINSDDTFTVVITWKETALPGQVDSNGDRLMLVTNNYTSRFLP